MNAEPTPLAGWLDQAEIYIRRFVVLSDDQAAAAVLWAAHTHAFRAASATPYLSVSSAEMESGKTRLLEVLRALVANPWFTGRTTSAALTRKVDKAAPSLLLDEGDPAFNGDKEYAETLRGVLNTGYRKGGAVTVCVGQGGNLDVRDFSTFCPKAIAGIGKLPDTVESRSIPIRLKKRLLSERIERFRERKARALGETIADGLAMSVEPILEELSAAEPELPDELSDRAQDVWEPLLAIGDAASGEWPTRAREAAVRLSSREPDEATLGVRLLADIRTVFDGEEQLTSEELRRRLREVEESAWSGWNEGEGIRARELANKLRPYGIRSHNLRTESGIRKGYRATDFEDAWRRYLPVPPDSKRYKRDIGLNKPETASVQALQDPEASRIENGQKPLEQADVADVADRSRWSATTEERWDFRHGPSRLPSADEIEAKARKLGLELFDDSEGS
jgi:hypothetical protein